MPNFIDLTGRTFGRLTVISKLEKDKWSQTFWACRCACGHMKNINGASLRNGLTQSCGCLQAERASAALAKTKRKHGYAPRGVPSREYRVWLGLKGRCGKTYNPRDAANYRERGIMVCDSWRNNFEVFLADMGPCPKGYSIDRINNDGNYEPGNCRWATPRQQARNRRSNRRVDWGGRSWLLVELSEHTGIEYHSLKSKLKRFSPEEAVAILTQNF